MSKRRVVITGLGIVCPVGNNVSDAWKNIINGVSGIAPIDNLIYGIVINDQGEVLISHERRNGFEFTKFPGGGLELGEGILDALKREFLEELGVPVESARLFYLNDFYQASVFKAEDQIISFYYLVTLKSSKINVGVKNQPVGSMDSSDFEFIEIKNTGNQLVNLTGIYFNGLGLSYQFPSNSTLAANSSLYLASNAATFLSRYGFSPFGEFFRNLSNSNQNLILSELLFNISYSLKVFL